MKLKDHYSPEIRNRLTQLKIALYKTPNIKDEQLLADLLDMYEFSTLSAYKNCLNLIKKRVSKGVTKKELFQLKLIYSFLGHFLQKLKEL